MAAKELARLRDVIPAEGYEAQSALIDKWLGYAAQGAEPDLAQRADGLREWLQTLLEAEYVGTPSRGREKRTHSRRVQNRTPEGT